MDSFLGSFFKKGREHWVELGSFGKKHVFGEGMGRATGAKGNEGGGFEAFVGTWIVFGLALIAAAGRRHSRVPGELRLLNKGEHNWLYLA